MSRSQLPGGPAFSAPQVWQMVPEMAANVFRTDLTRAGFAHLDLGPHGAPREFRAFLLSLCKALAEYYRQRFSRPLSYFALGRFDQQATTEAHRDGGPDESVLVLGYEPTTVPSRVVLLDYTRAALEKGLAPKEFLDQFNPLTPGGRAALAGHATQLSGFVPEHFHVVVLNNSCLPWELRDRGMLGVLHQATILVPDPAAARCVNSIVLTPAGSGAVGPDALRGFVESAATVSA